MNITVLVRLIVDTAFWWKTSMPSLASTIQNNTEPLQKSVSKISLIWPLCVCVLWSRVGRFDKIVHLESISGFFEKSNRVLKEKIHMLSAEIRFFIKPQLKFNNVGYSLNKIKLLSA